MCSAKAYYRGLIHADDMSACMSHYGNVAPTHTMCPFVCLFAYLVVSTQEQLKLGISALMGTKDHLPFHQ